MNGIPQSALGAYSRLRGLGQDWSDYDGYFNDGYFDATAQGVGDIAATTSTSWMDTVKSVGKSASELFTTYKTARAQERIIDLNAQRAARGLPPISGSTLAPTVNMGMSPEAMDFMLKLGLGLGAAYLASQLLKRRRR